MSAPSLPANVVSIHDFFYLSHPGRISALSGECREDSLRNIFKMSNEAGYLKSENRLDQLDKIQFCTQKLLEASQNRLGPIHWYISNRTLYLTLKMCDVDTHRTLSIYFSICYGYEATIFTYPNSPFTVLSEKKIVDNFKALLEGRTIALKNPSTKLELLKINSSLKV